MNKCTHRRWHTHTLFIFFSLSHTHSLSLSLYLSLSHTNTLFLSFTHAHTHTHIHTHLVRKNNVLWLLALTANSSIHLLAHNFFLKTQNGTLSVCVCV